MDRPIVIAHRGACGYLPEHSRGAKALAYAMGADYLEQDVIATRDGELVVLHDLTLDAVSDVGERFPGRARADGLHYCIDFDLAELRELRFRERVDPDTGAAKYPGRYPPSAGVFRVCTLSEDIAFVDAMNRSTGRRVGIYPEIKDPQWHREHGFDLGAAVTDALDASGYVGSGRPVYLQCFDAETLRAARERVGAGLRMIQLISSRTELRDGLLAEIAEYADGIGPSLKHVYRGRTPAGAADMTDLLSDAHAVGLVVHPYTLRVDDLPEGLASFEELLELILITNCYDGVFTDFCDVVAEFLHARQSLPQ